MKTDSPNGSRSYKADQVPFSEQLLELPVSRRSGNLLAVIMACSMVAV